MSKMKKAFLLTALLAVLLPLRMSAQMADSADVYIITCAPGTESYSIYGHTALRITIRGTTFDRVYNWGIFDFSTPNFTYRFAKGRLDYMLGAYSYEDFLREYIAEERSVWSQRLNLTTGEKEKLFELINENLKPENVKYRYDFFFDNCATRVRDIVAAAATDTVIFPVTEKRKQKSFRRLVDPNQKVLPWLDLGADMLLGLQADKKASPADEMFLPVHLMNNMLKTVIIHDGAEEPLTGPAEVVAEFTSSGKPGARVWVPQAVFYLVLILVLLITFVFGKPKLERVTDFVLYFIYSVIALLLVFTNLFSEHDALHFNLLFLGINILIPVLFISLFTSSNAVMLTRIAFFISLSWLPVSIIAGQGINPAIIPLVLIIMVRLFSRCRFGKKL